MERLENFTMYAKDRESAAALLSMKVAAAKMTEISEIKCGKIELALKARVIHLWSIPDWNNHAEEGSLHMLLLDEKCGKIHASIRKNLISLFKDQIDEGTTYVFESFMVGSNDHVYKTTDHKYKLNFMGGTKVFKVSSANIPATHFKDTDVTSNVLYKEVFHNVR